MPPLRLRKDDPQSDRLESLLLHCLAWSPDARIQTAHELREALVALHDPETWTVSDAEAFWRSAEKAAHKLAR
jgi:hypothetical protein